MRGSAGIGSDWDVLGITNPSCGWVPFDSFWPLKHFHWYLNCTYKNIWCWHPFCSISIRSCRYKISLVILPTIHFFTINAMAYHLSYLKAYPTMIYCERLQDQRLAPFNLFTVCHKKIVSFNLELPYKYINWRDTRELSENCESFLIIVWKLRSLLVYGRILRCRLFE